MPYKRENVPDVTKSCLDSTTSTVLTPTGDLKPENIFFDSQAVLKLGDFGLAKFSIGTSDHAYQSESGQRPFSPGFGRHEL